MVKLPDQIPMPNPYDWVTCGRAAEIIGVDRATISRMIDDKRLQGYRPEESAVERASYMLWRAEVERMAAARKIVAGDRS